MVLSRNTTSSNKVQLLNYFIVLLLLFASGNPIFIYYGNYQSHFIVTAIFLFLMCFIKRKTHIITSFILFFIPFLLFILFHLIAYGNTFSPVLFFIINVFIGCSALKLLGTRFTELYVNTMFWLAIISLLCFAFFSINPTPYGIPMKDGNRFSLVVYTLLPGEHGFLQRNSGMFWEPGAYQGYLNLALFFLLCDNVIKHKRLKFVILTAALLTTYSTTGYLVFAVLLLLFVSGNKKIPWYLKIVYIILIIAVSVYLYNTLDFLKDKIEWETTITMDKEKGRIMDYAYFSHEFAKHPLIGGGFVERASGNGFLSFLLCFGIFGIVYYFLMLLLNIRKRWSRVIALDFLLIIILCLQGEGFLSYPLFLGLPFIELKMMGNNQLTLMSDRILRIKKPHYNIRAFFL